LAKDIDIKDKESRNVLVKCAETALNSKLLSHYKTFFGEMVVSAVESLDANLLDKELIGIK
jgi:T-complex protein 1 subunit eta